MPLGQVLLCNVPPGLLRASAGPVAPCISHLVLALRQAVGHLYLLHAAVHEQGAGPQHVMRFACTRNVQPGACRGSDWANVAGMAFDSFATTTLDSQPLVLLQPSPALIVRCRIVRNDSQLQPRCPRCPYRRAQLLICSAKPLIPPATFRLPRAALALAGPRASPAPWGLCSSIPLNL